MKPGVRVVREPARARSYEAEREHLYTLLCRGEIKDEARRHIEHELDLREAQLAGGGHPM